MTPTQKLLESIAEKLVERMKHEKELGSTDWEKYRVKFTELDKKQMEAAVELLKDYLPIRDYTKFFNNQHTLN
jgi:hypothetical protein